MSGVEVAGLDGGTVSLSDEVIAEFAGSFHGSVERPGEPGYEDARLIWNGAIDKRPGLVLRCLGTAGAMAAVDFAREHGLLVAVRGGGHGVAGRAVIDGGLLIDLSLMRGVRVDPATNRVYVQGGARLGDLDKECQAYGLGVPAGIVGTTGVAGLTLGGGTGYQMRKHGLSIDNLISVEIVTADGQVRIASESENEDLFWAVRGGGGNFGVATSFEFQGHPLGPDVLVVAPWYPAKMGPEVIRAWSEFISDAHNDWGGQFLYWSIPAVDAFPQEIHDEKVAIPFLVYVGDDMDAAEKEIQPLRELGEPLIDFTSRMPWTTLQTLYDPFVPARDQKYYFKSLYVDRLDDEFIDFFAAAAEELPSPMTYSVLLAFGGKMAEKGPEDTAFGRRDMPYMLEFDAVWVDPADEERSIAWSRKWWNDAQRFSHGGGYLNVPGLGEDEQALVRASLGEANYDRLAAIKGKYDPDNMFRVNLNIVPAVAAS